MLQQDYPDDFVFGTGISHTVSEFMWLRLMRSELNQNGLGAALTKLYYLMEKQWLK